MAKVLLTGPPGAGKTTLTGGLKSRADVRTVEVQRDAEGLAELVAGWVLEEGSHSNR